MYLVLLLRDEKGLFNDHKDVMRDSRDLRGHHPRSATGPARLTENPREAAWSIERFRECEI
jgi:hypothetical protein